MPALPVATGLATGVAASLFCGEILVAGALISIGIGLWLWNKHLAGIFAMMVGTGMLLGIVRHPAPLPEGIADRRCTITGQVVQANVKANFSNLVVKTESIRCGERAPSSFHILLEANNFIEDKNLLNGCEVEMTGEIKPFDNICDIPGSRKTEIRHLIDGTSGQFIIGSKPIKVTHAPSGLLYKLENEGSAMLKHAIVNAGFDEETTVFLLATVSGDDTLLDSSTRSAYRSTGTAHLLALSGLHTGIVFAIAAFVLWWIRLLPGGLWLYYMAIALVVMAYAVMTGLSPSVARAAIMVMVYAIARMVQREPQTANALCVTVFVWLLYNPFWLFSPGFQLSVAAVAAIIWVNKLCKRIEPSRRMLKKTVTFIAIPLAAMAATVVISLTYFHGVPLYFLPVNLLVTLLAGPVIAGGIICSGFAALGVNFTIFPYLVSQGHSSIDAITGEVATWPHAYIEGIYLSPEQILAYLTMIACVVFAIHGGRRAPGYGAVVMAGALCFSFTLTPKPAGDEAFVLANRKMPVVVLRHNDTIYTISHLDSAMHGELTQSLRSYALRCGADSTMRGPRRFQMGTFARHDNIIRAGKHTIVMLDNRADLYYPHANYLLISHGWRGDIMQLAQTCNADTFVLMPDMNAIRRKRYSSTLRLIGKPVKEAPFRINL